MTNLVEAHSELPALYRLIDANLNRLQEGIRVVEDLFRFVHDHQEIASQLKNLRHEAKEVDYEVYLAHRDIEHDVLKTSTKAELERVSLDALIKANIKRSQQSARVLEEAFKLLDATKSSKYKQIRYTLYAIEKAILHA